ncbi:MAG: hypothetical protein SGJ02_02360 [bacterium]|nr:hypothetical protein [bacterium]
MFNALKAKKYSKEDSATAALSMQRLRIPLDRSMALIEQTGAALQSARMVASQKKELPFIVSVASSPGAIDPLVQLMKDAQALIRNSTLKGGAEAQKALTLCLSAMSEFFLNGEKVEENDAHLAACGVDREQLSRPTHTDTYSGSSSSGGDDGFWPWHWWSSPDRNHSDHNTHNMGQHGHDSALCGSSSDHGSSGDHSGSHSSCSSSSSCGSSC